MCNRRVAILLCDAIERYQMIILLIRQDIDIMIGIVCARLRIVGSHQPIGLPAPLRRANRGTSRAPSSDRHSHTARRRRPTRATASPGLCESNLHATGPSADPILRGRAARRVVRCDSRHAREIRSVPPANHPRASVCTQYTLHRRADAWPRHGRTIQY